MVVETQAFSGFKPEAIDFLAELGQNNDRAWFQPRKAEYERLLKEPMEAFVAALGESFARHRLPLQADPKTSIFRIYRDTRFAKDKSPYKTNVAAGFPWIEGVDAREEGNPGGYFHMAPGEAWLGGGMWHPPTAKLAAFRHAVVDDSAGLHKVLDDKDFVRVFGGVSGEDKLKRVPPGFPADHPDAELLKQKSLTFGHRLADDDVFSPRLVDIVTESFVIAAPFMRYLAKLAR